MFKNYLITAFRNLLRNKLYSLINIGGLALGLAACILILLFVRDELSYDDWIPHAERIFKMELTIPLPGRPTLLLGQVPPAIAPAMESYFPDDIEATTRVLQVDSVLGQGERSFNERISFVDAGFFKVFELEMVAGSSEELAHSISAILISESQARKYFGDQDPVGQNLYGTIVRNFWDDSDPELEFRVAGVFRDLPKNTHLPFQMLALIDPGRFSDINEVFGAAWLDAAYVRFYPKADPTAVESRLPEFYASVAPPRGDESEDFDYRTDRKLNLINVRDVYLYSDKIQQLKPIGDIGTVISFSLAAGLILVIAAINFMNLATARALRRAKEVSLRKVLGANRRQLIHQFMGEAILTALLALAIALVLVESALPFFNHYVDKAMQLDLLHRPLQTAAIVLAAMLVGALGGLYPAVFLSSYRPAHVMGTSASGNRGSPLMRQALVIFQFALSIALIAVTAIVYQQTELLRNMALGFDTGHKLAITGIGSELVRDREPALRQELLKLPEVKAVALSSDELPLVFYNDVSIEIPSLGVTEAIDTDRIFVDARFLDLYGIEPVAGRLFGEEFTADALVKPDDKNSPWTRNAIVTEPFVQSVGLGRAEDLLGTVLVIPDYGPEGETLQATVVGVVPQLHMRALKERTAPIVFFTTDTVLDVMTLDLLPGNLPATLAAIDNAWKKAVPGAPIKRYFVDEEYDALYNSEARRSEVFAAFSVFAIFVACLGLFGLTAYSAEQRTLEIGIRKVHGARVFDILTLTGAQFVKSVLWANVVAWPVVYLVMSDWLKSYEYRVEISPLLIVACSLLALLLACATIAWQVMKVARSNPIHALRYE